MKFLNFLSRLEFRIARYGFPSGPHHPRPRPAPSPVPPSVRKWLNALGWVGWVEPILIPVKLREPNRPFEAARRPYR